MKPDEFNKNDSYFRQINNVIKTNESLRYLDNASWIRTIGIPPSFPPDYMRTKLIMSPIGNACGFLARPRFPTGHVIPYPTG